MKLSRFVAFATASLIVSGVACGKKEKGKGKIAAKMRSTGIKASTSLIAMSLEENTSSEFNAATVNMLANSAFTIDSFKVPVSRINLVNGLSGTGYTSASPNIYVCPYKTDAECLVDISKGITVDNLLAGGKSGEEKEEIEQENTVTYNGVAVEFCNESGGTGLDRKFSAVLKGSVNLNGTTYYTNATSGLSASAPAEEISIEVKNAGCGHTTPLLTPVEWGKDKEISVVLYAEPNGSVFATNYKSAANASCKGEETLAVCFDYVPIFGTVDTAAPTVERYLLSPTDTSYAPMVATMLMNTADEPFGLMVRHYYNNTTKGKLLHSGLSASSISKTGTKVYDIKNYDGTNIIKSFTRGVHSSTIEKMVDSAQTYSAVVY